MGKIGDIWVRLGLKKNDFDAGLKKADSDIKGFGAGVGKMGSAAGAALKGIAGAAGLAVGGIEAFNKMITANETNNDKWENTMRAMNNVVNEFFSALTSGDFTGFQNGLDGIARKARETAEALRQIDDAQTVYRLFSTENRAAFNEALVTIRDKNASPEAVEAAKKNIEDIIAKQTEQNEVLAQKAITAASNIIAQRGNIDASDITEVDIKDMLNIALDRQGGIRSEELERQYDEYVTAYKNLRADYSAIDQSTGLVMFQGGPDYIAALKELNNQYANANLYNALWDKTNGNNLKQLVSLLQSAYAARSEIASMQRTYNRATQTKLDTDTGTKKDKDIPAVEGSIAYLQEKLKEAKDSVLNAVSDEARAVAQATVDEIEKQISQLQYRADWQSAFKRGKLNEFVIGEDNMKLSSKEWAELDSIEPPDIDVSDIEFPVPDVSKVEDYRSQIDETSNSIGILAGAMSNLGGLVDSQAASWMSYAGNVVQAIAQAIPAISALTEAKRADANMGAAKLAADAGGSVANVPFAGPALAVAAIASVIAALAAVPKFAGGGVVGGNSYYGDRILARLNSGELVLNTDQQRRLFAHMERPVQKVEITGRMTASGRDLQYIFDKYSDYRRQ